MPALNSSQKAELFQDIARSGVDIAASKLLTTQQAAALLGLSPHTLERRRCMKNPVLPAVVIASRVRYRLSDALALLQPEGSTHA